MFSFHHVCIQTDCYQRSLDFYQHVLGFSLELESPGFHGRAYNTWLERDGFRIELQTAKRSDHLVPFNKDSAGLVHFCLYTSAFDQIYQEILSAGFNRFQEKNGDHIYNVEGGRLFKMIAPEGTVIEVRDTVEIL